MIRPLLSATATRLEKAALDNGFDQEQPAPEGWLTFATTQAPLRIWLTQLDNGFLVAFSQVNVARALAEHGTAIASPLPEGATAGRAVSDIPSLHRLVRRAFQLARTLPDELLHAFEKQTEMFPKTTAAERLVVRRVGQDIFRAGLIDYWEGRCAITGLAVPELLRASHIKPWADCESDAERLDVFNGFLLAPHLDAVFDRGFITIAADGAVPITQDLGADARKLLGLHQPLSVIGLTDGHRHYLAWHRRKVYRGKLDEEAL